MIDLRQGDCLELMKSIPDGSVDCVIADVPYGTTACKWDSVIDFDLMWAELKRIVKPNGATVLFGSEPFSSALRMSNIEQYKYDWIWRKNIATNFLHAKRQPLRASENISVFIGGASYYHPQMTIGHKPTSSSRGVSEHKLWAGTNRRNDAGGNTNRYPQNIIHFDVVSRNNRLHPTEKPVALLEYLIKTYSSENETVLDFTAGSMSTAIACINTNRKGIMIEKDDHYFKIGTERVSKALKDRVNSTISQDSVIKTKDAV